MRPVRVAIGAHGSYRSLVLSSTLRALEPDLLGGAGAALPRHLREVLIALRNGSVRPAIRLMDRAWRTLRVDAQALAPIYARLLSLEDRDQDAALRLLQRVEVPDADIAALTTHALLGLSRADEARQQLDLALLQYALAPAGLLAREASEALDVADVHAVGWLGLGPALKFSGELAFGVTADSLEIRLGSTAFETPVKWGLHDGRTVFSFRPPQTAADGILHVSAGGVPLLGSGRRLPLEFSLDGRADADGELISGWARVGWQPAQPVILNFEDEDGRSHRARTQGVARAGFRWPFRINRRRAGLRGSRIRITAQLPDGRWRPLPDTPLLLPRALRVKGLKPARIPHWRQGNSVVKRVRLASSRPAALIDVVIPVYRGREETLACIGSVLATIGERGRIIVVDDATDEALLAAALDDLAAAGRITLLRNEQNLGFVRSVNRALALDSGHDIVLLNSDTLVFDDWLPRLSAAAYSAAHVGTVTPLSNDGSIASYPRGNGAPIDAADAGALHKLAAWTHPGISIEVPVGVGFCLYMRRDCLEEIGELDAAVFGVGYGEETDFCMRARLRGWSHRIAADVFVYHASGRSFGARRSALLDRSQRLLNLRYPGYHRYIMEFLAQDPMGPVRRRLDERRLSSFEGRFVLLVTLALEGGVERFVTERGREIRAQGAFPLVLRPRKAGDRRHCELWTDAIDVPNLQYEIPAGLPELTSLLRRLRIDEIEISHFLHLDARLINAVRALGVPYDVVLHDYAWICPQVTLIDGSGRYCGEPAVSVCRSCVRKNGSQLGENISVPALRARSAGWLAQARRVLAPSADAATRLSKYFPGVEIQARPNAAPFSAPLAGIASSPRSKKIRVALIGAIGVHKGYDILLACARDAVARRLPLEFVVIGYTMDDAPLLRTGKVFVTGRYLEIEVPQLLRRERPDVVFLPSVWPETWCYTLDYAVNAGLSVVSYDLGAIAERLRAAGLGLLLPLELTAAQINDRIVTHVSDDRIFGVTEGNGNRDQAQLSGMNPAPYVQKSEIHDKDDARIREAMEPNMTNPAPREASQEEGLSASVQVLPLPTGLYLFSVKAAAPQGERAPGKLQLPAMHVGLGPGVGADQVEFIAGPGTAGAWLFAHGDVLVAKINGAGATLILTSVRASNGEVLSIEVERLEARSETAAAPPADAAREVHEPDVGAAVATQPKSADNVPLEITTHIRSRGDMSFADAPWAGRVAPGLWIESFSVRPLEHLASKDIEYKGLTGTGFETPWLSGEQFCGTKGMSMPLVGFAVRLKPGAEASSFDCEYSGYYRSGATVGPLRNGAPCRSTVASDPLEGIQIRIVKRPKSAHVLPKVAPQRPGLKSPSFGRYRDGETGAANGTPNGTPNGASNGAVNVLRDAPKSAPRIKPVDVQGKAERGARSANRTKNRIL